MLTSFCRMWKAFNLIIDFCWSVEGWIGTENIRQSKDFLEIMAEARSAAIDFEKYIPKAFQIMKG